MKAKPVSALVMVPVITHYLNSFWDWVSLKRVQKLLYYMEAWHLVNFDGQPLFKEDFEAWVHGPVIPAVRHKYKGQKLNDIEVINDEESIQTNPSYLTQHGLQDKEDFIYEMLDAYAGYSAFELEYMTHNEEPWIEARGDCDLFAICKNIISKQHMYTYYSSRKNAKTTK